MVRLVDVAKAAGVSRGTASNVYNNPELVRPELRERVLAAADALGYLGPDAKGRLLRSGKFNAVALMVPRDWGVADALRNPVFLEFIHGVSEVCDEAGASLLLVPDGVSMRSLNTALADGYIFGRVEHMAQIEPARLRNSPFAVVDFDPGPGVNAVRVDARSGGYAVARHLLDLGHRRFGILSFLREAGAARMFPPGAPRPPDAAGMPTDQEKYAGYAQALSEFGIDISDVPMIQADPWDQYAAGNLLDAAPDITAVLSMAVMQGMMMLTEASRRGIAVPEALSVVGYNDIPDAARSSPPLTTVNGLGREKGRAAARLIFSGDPPRQEILQPVLILRGSTAPPPIF